MLALTLRMQDQTMDPLLHTSHAEEPAPTTLRSPASALRVRDHVVPVHVEHVEHVEHAAEELEPATCRYDRVA